MGTNDLVLTAGVVIGAVLLAAFGPLLIRRERRAGAPLAGTSNDTIDVRDRSDWLFMIPTLNDRVPLVDRGSNWGQGTPSALLHDDDWRQEEFTPVSNRAFIEKTLEQLMSHRAVHQAGAGFREVFVRTEPPNALDALEIKLSDLEDLLGKRRISLFLNGSRARRAIGGFAILLPDVGFLYGQEIDGVVSALGLGLVGGGVGDVSELSMLSERYGLLFVDWVRGVVVEPGDASGFRAWLDASISRQSEEPS